MQSKQVLASVAGAAMVVGSLFGASAVLAEDGNGVQVETVEPTADGADNATVDPTTSGTDSAPADAPVEEMSGDEEYDEAEGYDDEAYEDEDEAYEDDDDEEDDDEDDDEDGEYDETAAGEAEHG